MTDSARSIPITLTQLYLGIAWCLAWGEQRQPQFDLKELQQMREALLAGTAVPEKMHTLVAQVQQLQAIKEFPAKIADLKAKYRDLWQQTTRIGLVYGGATKIKGYVFEAAKLQDIRGASALLDRINLVDLKAFFGDPKPNRSISNWLAKNFPGLEAALIPELIIYSTGGNILAFCPAAYVDDLANAIERRYTEETLTANSCAVGDKFRLLEIRFGLLRDSIEETPWLEWYEQNRHEPLVEAYFGRPEAGENWAELFKNRKSFNELAGKLAAQFNHRRSGNDLPDSERPSRRYPPMFETHPYLIRDESDRRSAVSPADGLPDTPWFSDALARKHIVGQRTKREGFKGQKWWDKNPAFRWRYGEVKRLWNSGKLESWVFRFARFLNKPEHKNKCYPYKTNLENIANSKIEEARSITEIGNASNGFVAYIYADGNNMGGYIQKIQTPADYAQFSKDIFDATENSVYEALAQHLKPHRLNGLTGKEHQHRNGVVIHPFEILTIGGDDVLLIVPADKALEIAKTIGEEFEKQLTKLNRYQIPESQRNDSKSVTCHRSQPQPQEPSQCQLSMSIGVLITAYNTPIYYAQHLTEQLLKSAKARAKDLKKHYHYYGGTVEFLVMKSVTMISSNIGSFRKEGLTKSIKDNQTLKLYAAPYTLHELGGLLETAKAIKKSGFPRSQLYQIRSLLERGKNTAMLNYRYFRVRLGSKEQKLLKERFEDVWCQAKTNDGNLAPWMYLQDPEKSEESAIYETIWRELVDLYPFIEVSQTVDARIPIQ